MNIHLFNLQPDHLEKIGTMISEYSGIQLNRLLIKHVTREIASQMKKYSTEDPEEYISILKTKDGYTFVMDDLISAISVSESYFFRNRSQFEYMYYEFFPEFFDDPQRNKYDLNIWSAGCSRGEEPYSVSILTSQYKKENPLSSFRIRAGDISSTNLNLAKKGRFSQNSIRKGFNGYEHIFGTIDGNYEKNDFIVPSEYINKVNFTKLNLKEPREINKLNGTDIIMCRNVLIYFNEELVSKIINAFYKCLNPKGIMLLGETECLPKNNSKFKTINYKNTYIFQKTV